MNANDRLTPHAAGSPGEDPMHADVPSAAGQELDRGADAPTSLGTSRGPAAREGDDEREEAS